MDLDKKEIRQYIYNKRKELDLDKKNEWDSIILKKLTDNKFYKNAQIIFVYVSFEGEVDTQSFINLALSEGKTVCVPKVISKKEGMEAYKITGLSDLKAGFYGILEPSDTAQIVNPADIDLIIMPGVAFDKTGGRVGYGGGFYDRYLKRLGNNTKLIALAYEFQIIDKIPTEDFDEKVRFVITNS